MRREEEYPVCRKPRDRPVVACGDEWTPRTADNAMPGVPIIGREDIIGGSLEGNQRGVL